jgi:hypothetical protein
MASLAAGTYSVRVLSAGEAGGEYVLAVMTAPIPLAARAPLAPAERIRDDSADFVFDSLGHVPLSQFGQSADWMNRNSLRQRGGWSGDGVFDISNSLHQRGHYVDRPQGEGPQSALDSVLAASADGEDFGLRQSMAVDDLMQSRYSDAQLQLRRRAAV